MDTTTNSIHWFGRPVKDLKRAKKFDRSAFGIKIAMMGMDGLMMAMFPQLPTAACDRTHKRTPM